MSEIIPNVIPAQLASEIEWHLGHSVQYTDSGLFAKTKNDHFSQLIEDAAGEFATKLQIDPELVHRELQIVERGGASSKRQDRVLHQDGVTIATCALSSYRWLNPGTVCVEGVKVQFQYGKASEKILTNRMGIFPNKQAKLKRKYYDIAPINQAPHRGAIRFSGATYHFAPALPRNTGRLLLLVNGE